MTKITLSTDQLNYYKENKYLIIRNVLPTIVSKELHQLALKQKYTHWWWSYHFNTLGVPIVSFLNFRTKPEVREYIINHPLLKAISQIENNAQKIRFLADHLAGIENGGNGFNWHTDLATFGIIDSNENDTGTSIWCPVWDENQVTELNQETGGLMALQLNLSNIPQDCMIKKRRSLIIPKRNASCQEYYEKNRFIFSMKNGDCLLFAQETLHRTDPIKLQFLKNRFVYITRFIKDGVKGSTTGNNSPLNLPHSSCYESWNIDMKYNISTECYPVIYPEFNDQDMALMYYEPWSQLIPLLKLHGVLNLLHSFILYQFRW